MHASKTAMQRVLNPNVLMHARVQRLRRVLLKAFAWTEMLTGPLQADCRDDPRAEEQCGMCDCQRIPVQDLPDRDPEARQSEDAQRQHRGTGHAQQSGRGQGQAPGTE
eukprot:7897358-Pyramimonas_sp.AAC.1